MSQSDPNPLNPIILAPYLMAILLVEPDIDTGLLYERAVELKNKHEEEQIKKDKVFGIQTIGGRRWFIN